jgi:hypothetical protein
MFEFTLLEFLKAKHDKLREYDKYLGIWTANKSIYFDVGSIFLTQQAALRRAFALNQIAFFDIEKQEPVYVMKEKKRPSQVLLGGLYI